MKNTLVSTRKSALTIAILVATMFALLFTNSQAIVVHEETYSMNNQNFFFTFTATHDDDFIDFQGPPVVEGTSNLYVSTSIIIRDGESNIVSSSAFVAQMSGGEVDVLTEIEDIGMYFDGYIFEGHQNGESEINFYAEFIPPGTLENFTVEVLLEKWTDSDDTHDVTFDDYN